MLSPDAPRGRIRANPHVGYRFRPSRLFQFDYGCPQVSCRQVYVAQLKLSQVAGGIEIECLLHHRPGGIVFSLRDERETRKHRVSGR